MPQSDYEQKLAELDQILNDPGVPLNPARVWTLLAEIVRHRPDSGDRRTCAGPDGDQSVPAAAHQAKPVKITGVPWGFHPLEK